MCSIDRIWLDGWNAGLTKTDPSAEAHHRDCHQMAEPTEPTPEPSPIPRSIEVLLESSRRLRAEADRLEEQARKLKEAIVSDRKTRSKAD
jgi:hypothetical protein